jgi:hypothetical protein
MNCENQSARDGLTQRLLTSVNLGAFQGKESEQSHDQTQLWSLVEMLEPFSSYRQEMNLVPLPWK